MKLLKNLHIRYIFFISVFLLVAIVTGSDSVPYLVGLIYGAIAAAIIAGVNIIIQDTIK